MLHFSVERHVSKYIWIYKTDTEIYRVIYYVCSCECGVNSLSEIRKRFNIWTRHLWKNFKVGPVYQLLATEDESWTSAGKNGRWVVYFVTSREAKVRYISDASKNRKMLVSGKFWSTRVGNLIVATIYLQLIQNRYMFPEVLLSFSVVTSIVYNPLPAMWKS